MFESPEILSYSELGRAPRAPGIYAWYYLPRVGPMDRDNYAYVVQQMSSAIQKSRPEALELYTDKKKKIRWRGHVEPEIDELSLDAGQPIDETAHLIADFLKPSTLTSLLSPIYVGMAVDQTLRERLAAHTRVIDSVDSLEKADNLALLNLGERIKARSMEIRSLYIVTVPVGEYRPADIEYSESQAKAIRIIERFLLTNANPNLSRQ